MKIGENKDSSESEEETTNVELKDKLLLDYQNQTTLNNSSNNDHIKNNL
jgi:hypothetical protein